MRVSENGVIQRLRKPHEDHDQVSARTGLVCNLPTRTQQQFRDETDINTILKRFGVTGRLPLTAKQPLVGDFSDIGDFQTALQAVEDANDNFMQLPASVRARFGHSPRQFVEFCVNPANIEEVRALKLAPQAKPAIPSEPTELPDGNKPS